MSLDKHVNELLGLLESLEPKEFNVVVMPDFFLDRLVTVDLDVSGFSKMLAEVVSRKGGAIDGIKQLEFRGGNTANTASALAKLGAKVHVIIQTGKIGMQMLEHYLKPLEVDLSHVKVKRKTSITTAIELKYNKEGKANVMLRDLGSLENFGPKDLTEEDFKLLEKADYVCLFNWAGTRKHGTELAKTIFRHVKEKGVGKTYYDTADPSPNEKGIGKLVKEVFLSNIIDILSLNENEAVRYASIIGLEEKIGGKTLEEKARKSGEILSNQISSRIDLHTTAFSSTFQNGKEVHVPTFKVGVLRATGAGDAWNAGNIFADAHDFPDSLRLTFANAVAAYYISSPEAEHPTLEELQKFLKRKR